MRVTAQNLSDLSGIEHGFFTREGGVSEGIYRGLNCGPGSGDDLANVLENRRRVAQDLTGQDGPLVTCYQVHGAEVVEVTEPWTPAAAPKADALITQERQLVLGVLTADCVPVLFADPVQQIIGAAHAGWRGALAGVTDSVVEAMVKRGAERQNIVAAVGPCIQQLSYEVGRDLYDALCAQEPDGARFFAAGQDKDHFQFDVSGYVQARLNRQNIGSVEALSLDTYADEERFFSYRRTCHRKEGDYGRQISAIALAA